MIRRIFCPSLIAGCMLSLTSCGMSVNGINVGKIADLSTNIAKSAKTSQADELLLGDQLAAMLLGASKLHESSDWQHYVNQVGRYLANYSNRPDLPWTFAVLDTPDVNAFAVPGGYVFVTSGLLSMLHSEAELAAVLSHEIIHVDQRHQLIEMERQNKLEILQTIGSVAAEYKAATAETTSAKTLQNQRIAESVLGIGHSLYTKGLSRDDELQADALAVRLAARAGYDPYALAAVMQRLDAIDNNSSGLQLLLSTHPTPFDRLSALQLTLPQLPTDRHYVVAEQRFTQHLVAH